MLAYLIRRLLLAIPTIIGVCIITFALFFLVATPDQQARRNIGAKNPSPQMIQAWKVKHGYADPKTGRELSKSTLFVSYMRQLLTFQFGVSDVTGEPIGDKIRHGMGPSLSWTVPAFLFGLLVTIPTAIMVAYVRGSYLDRWVTVLCVALMSIAFPLYVIVGQFVMGKELRIAPIMGYESGLRAIRFLVMPVVISVIGGAGGSIRFYRTVFLEEMGQDYARTARAKGVGESGVLFRHVLKNAMIPVLTSVVMAIPFLFLGGLVMENYFGIPGLGAMTIDAINSFDFSVLRVMVYISAILMIIGAILTDIAYTLVDPRVRL